MKKVAHLTSVHSRRDTRIYVKQCKSLKMKGYNVTLIVADGQGHAIIDSINVIDVGKSSNRLHRIIRSSQRILKEAIRINADIYHLHDPELLMIAGRLKKLGKVVIFDSHEDVPKQILGKAYLNKYISYIISRVYDFYEKRVCKNLDFVVAATPYIRDKFKSNGIRSVDVKNYPSLEELKLEDVDWSKKKRQVIYVGGLDRVRGIKEMTVAMSDIKSDVKLLIGGSFNDSVFAEEVRSHISSKNNVQFLGWLDRESVKIYLSQSMVGLVTLHPRENYIDALPVKMFEYMAMGIPVVASKFPLWEEIVKTADCGLCVDPIKPSEIARAITYLIDNPEIAYVMGQNGRKAVLESYNWDKESVKLFDLYAALIRRSFKSSEAH